MNTPLTDDYYTYEEWAELDDGNRYELLGGEIIMMAPPSTRHQKISGEIFKQIAVYLDDKPCDVYSAPFGVRLHKKKDTAFQPDITVVCDPSKITEKGCVGAPDLIVEILSSSTARHDKITKFREYLRAGVKEYWIVNPEEKLVTAYRLKDGEYVADVYGDDSAPAQVLPGCEIDLAKVFRE